LGQAWRQGASHATLGRLVGFLLALVGALAVYVAWQMRAGHWIHPDASLPAERRSLNRFLLWLMPLGALASWRVAHDVRLTLALALGSAMVILALMLRERLKLSLHVAFAVFAALVWVPSVMAVLLGGLLAVGVAWFRWALGRHTVLDVWVGACSGGMAGGLYVVGQGVWGVV
jgi:hypothetical protein